jgi:hypothetical protein
MDVELTSNEQARLAKRRPVNPDALEAFLKGVYFPRKQTSGYQKAPEHFDQIPCWSAAELVAPASVALIACSGSCCRVGGQNGAKCSAKGQGQNPT